MVSLRVAIIGAGIGGLTTAIALRDRGIDATIYEQAPELKGLGAGVAIAPNGSRVLTRLGLADTLSAAAGRISRYTFRAWRSDTGSTEPLELSPNDPERTWTLHRGELQKLLCDALPTDKVRLNHLCIGAEETDDGVSVAFADGSVVHADLVIGADGIHSRLQGVVGRPTAPVSEGIMAFRGLIPAERLDGTTEVHESAMWIGPGQSVVTYPVSGGALLNIVAFVPTNLDVLQSWTAPGDVNELAGRFQGWDPTLLAIIAALEETFRWGIYDREPLDAWSTGRITLMGDAAHAVVPHLGQGANQAIEDAITLAVLLEDIRPQDIPQRLAVYHELRLSRTRHVRHKAREAGMLYRSQDLDNAERAKRLAEIYQSIEINTYDAEQIAQAALRNPQSPAIPRGNSYAQE